MQLDTEQRAAVDAARKFVTSGEPGWRWIGGLAGTGKTTVLQEIARKLPSAPLLAPTNRAANVIGGKLDRKASTIHRAILRYKGESKNEKGEWKTEWADKPFNARTVLLDECSMVDAVLGAKLQAVCNKIIAFGDPGQLGPVDKSGPYFDGEPHILLQKNYRSGDAIVRQALAVREGRPCENDGATFQVIEAPLSEFAYGDATILCQQNTTRQHINTVIRAKHGIAGTIIRRGERIISRCHIEKLNITKGDIFVVAKDRQPGQPLQMVSNETGEQHTIPNALVDQVDVDLITYRPRAFDKVFAFGYCGTVTMAQGGEFPHVVVIKDYGVPPGAKHEYRRHMYTAITRASQRVTILQPGLTKQQKAAHDALNRQASLEIAALIETMENEEWIAT